MNALLSSPLPSSVLLDKITNCLHNNPNNLNRLNQHGRMPRLHLPQLSNIRPLILRHLFYHDLPKEEGEYRVSKLRSQSTNAFTSGTDSYAGWLDVPVWYIATVEDKALPVFVQRMMVQMAEDQGADVRQLREVETGLTKSQREIMRS